MPSRPRLQENSLGGPLHRCSPAQSSSLSLWGLHDSLLNFHQREKFPRGGKHNSSWHQKVNSRVWCDVKSFLLVGILRLCEICAYVRLCVGHLSGSFLATLSAVFTGLVAEWTFFGLRKKHGGRMVIHSG